MTNLLKLNLTLDQIMDLSIDTISLAKQNGFQGFAGQCGMAAMAINDVLFDGEQKLFACFNTALSDKWHHVGHVGCMVEYGEDEYFILDSDAEIKSINDIESWGMLDSTDQMYIDLFLKHKIPLDEINFEAVSQFTLDTDFIYQNFDCTQLDEQKNILKNALIFVLKNNNINKNTAIKP